MTKTPAPPQNILEAISSPDWWGPWFEGDWTGWRTFLAYVFGLPLPPGGRGLFEAATASTAVPEAMARELYAICGRRAGKTKITSLIAAYMGCFVDWSPYLSRGEKAHVVLSSINRDQAGVALDYIKSYVCDHPILKRLVKSESAGMLELTNNVVIRTAAASYRGLRGYAICCMLMDELAAWFDGDTSSNPASEIIRAVRPAQLQFRGKALLMGLSTPLKREGVLWDAYANHWAKPGSTRVWLARTDQMKPLSREEQADIAREFEQDPEGSATEYNCVWRDDVYGFLDAALIESCTDAGVTQRAALPGIEYSMCADFSDGKADSTAAAIGHVEDGVVIVDALFEKKAPFQPSEAFRELAAFARPYRIARVQTDQWAAGLVGDGLKAVGLLAEVRERSTSDTFLASVPIYTEGAARLTDDRQLQHQFSILQRRVGASGKATVSHPPRTHDDLAAAVCSLVVMLGADKKRSLIDHRRIADGVEAPRDIQAVMGSLWVDRERYAWVVGGLYEEYQAGPKHERLIVLGADEGVWSWDVLGEVAASMRRAADVAPAVENVPGILYCPENMKGWATQALGNAWRDKWRAPDDAVGFARDFWQAPPMLVGAAEIEDHWLADPARLVLSVSALVGSGRVTRGAGVDPGVFRYLHIKHGERLEDEPARVALLIAAGALLPERMLRPARGVSRMEW